MMQQPTEQKKMEKKMFSLLCMQENLECLIEYSLRGYDQPFHSSKTSSLKILNQILDKLVTGVETSSSLDLDKQEMHVNSDGEDDKLNKEDSDSEAIEREKIMYK
jgi:hypothetical protein